MPKHANKPITSVRYYNCGYCINEMFLAFKKHKPEKKIFPSGVFLIKHSTEGCVLFDTGYSESIYNTGLRGFIYRSLNPTYVNQQNEIATQFSNESVNPDDIRYVILSHLHPDHIGGVKFFPKSTIIISEGIYKTYKNPRWNDLLFPQLLPKWFDKKLQILRQEDRQQIREGLYGYDLFKDGSLILVELEGHAQGQIGAYIPDKLLLASDACWGKDLINHSRSMRLPARLILNDYAKFKDTLDRLKALQKKGIKLYFSHDHYQQKELLK